MWLDAAFPPTHCNTKQALALIAKKKQYNVIDWRTQKIRKDEKMPIAKMSDKFAEATIQYAHKISLELATKN